MVYERLQFLAFSGQTSTSQLQHWVYPQAHRPCSDFSHIEWQPSSPLFYPFNFLRNWCNCWFFPLELQICLWVIDSSWLFLSLFWLSLQPNLWCTLLLKILQYSSYLLYYFSIIFFVHNWILLFVSFSPAITKIPSIVGLIFLSISQLVSLIILILLHQVRLQNQDQEH